jgi:hypothetical protein
LVIRELGKLHAAWWGDARLDQTPWLPMKGILTPDQAPVVLIQNWESFLGKLSIPVTDEMLSAGDSARATVCSLYLHVYAASANADPPRRAGGQPPGRGRRRTVARARRLAADDSRPTGPRIWPDFVVAHLRTSERRRHEDRLLEIYHSVLTERGVADYPLEQCRDDYRMALLLPASRLATAVGLHPGLTATPDGFWNVAFPRYARALTDLGVSELLQQHYG